MTPSKPANKEEPPWLILSSYSHLRPDINGLSRYQLLCISMPGMLLIPWAPPLSGGLSQLPSHCLIYTAQHTTQNSPHKHKFRL